MAASSTRKRESKQNQREIFEVIKSKTKEVIQSRKNVNNIIDIQSNLEVSDLISILSDVNNIAQSFLHYKPRCFIYRATTV